MNISRRSWCWPWDSTATLNADELEALQDWAPFDEHGEDMRRLRAALVAEGVRYLLAGRTDLERANELANTVLQLLAGPDTSQMVGLRNKLLDDVRGVRGAGGVPGTSGGNRMVLRGATGGASEQSEADDAERIERALDAGVETYEQGAMWLAVARDTSERGARLGYVALATSLFNRARDLVAKAPMAAQNTPLQQEWLATIDAALAEAADVR